MSEGSGGLDVVQQIEVESWKDRAVVFSRLLSLLGDENITHSEWGCTFLDEAGS